MQYYVKYRLENYYDETGRKVKLTWMEYVIIVKKNHWKSTASKGETENTEKAKIVSSSASKLIRYSQCIFKYSLLRKNIKKIWYSKYDMKSKVNHSSLITNLWIKCRMCWDTGLNYCSPKLVARQLEYPFHLCWPPCL